MCSQLMEHTQGNVMHNGIDGGLLESYVYHDHLNSGRGTRSDEQKYLEF